MLEEREIRDMLTDGKRFQEESEDQVGLLYNVLESLAGEYQALLEDYDEFQYEKMALEDRIAELEEELQQNK